MQRYFSTPVVFSAPAGQIDRENGIIQGVTIAKIGLAKGHGAFIDKAFLLQMVDNASTKPAGIKARFGHPNMCSTALGSYLGRFKNYSYSGDQVKADLHLDATAKNSPSGDLFTYVLDMAEKNPDMFGASIHFEPAESIFLKEEIDGKKVEKEYFRLKELRATDIVDDPAATDGLFSSTTFPGIATQFLDENPEILDLIFSKPDSVFEFFNNYLNNTKMNLSDKIKLNFAAFIAAFSPKSSEQEVLGTEHAAPGTEDNTLNTLFDALCNSFPESFSNVDGFNQLQKAESLTAFLFSMNEKLTTINKSFEDLNTEHQALIASTAEANATLETTQQELSSANTTIEDLTQQLGARPSIPLNVTDPALSSGNQDKDETGKQILESMPKDLKRKLK